MLHKFRIVLVNTSHPGNIGGAARAMKTMGLSRLVLVQPEIFPSEIADARASGATDLLQSAQVVNSLDEALVGCQLVLGTSARERHIPWPLLEPRAAAERCGACTQQGGEVALVFGREHAGLTNEELQRCHIHIHIPSDPNFASLNLAAAVQVLAYELRLVALSAEKDSVAPVHTPDPDTQPVTADELEQFYQHLEQTLIDIRFLDPERPRHLMARLRRLYGRADIERLEMNILRGILTETRKIARQSIT
ncbi:tRNA/rRNA methyltransferase/tRNA (cytidine32/uridine32-2'-O)-methyltransferase [Azomonas agilis]|uniref:tRNA (cytidine/uridine-2'-O-)-methyltransferase TrmJ n=1 Tax=Azomonas agilis TaxID=116849 RepID=A0A562IZU8_9GAMM|nr:tRNA (cytosine(32)/uridine(32)-2'-O)-methyltransferase TrmJ [Azomonas agilis]TWH76456.1 tRNA/rRNA methyltransferase/tRNA (cytidine32/uridine32-2'-O)-methyltransferase [Azomonas agilis]